MCEPPLTRSSCCDTLDLASHYRDLTRSCEFTASNSLVAFLRPLSLSTLPSCTLGIPSGLLQIRTAHPWFHTLSSAVRLDRSWLGKSRNMSLTHRDLWNTEATPKPWDWVLLARDGMTPASTDKERPSSSLELSGWGALLTTVMSMMIMMEQNLLLAILR